MRESQTPGPYEITPEDVTSLIMVPRVEEMVRKEGHTVIEKSDRYTSLSQVCNGIPYLTYKLRDRRDDGIEWRQTELVDWHYGGPEDLPPKGRTIEESIYMLDPNFPLSDIFTPQEAVFISNPFAALPYHCPTEENLIKYFQQWCNIVTHDEVVYPRYFTRKNIPGLYHEIHERSTKLLKERGFNYLSAVPTWFHIAKLYEQLGFEYFDDNDAGQIKLLTDKVSYKTGHERRISSWIITLQYWAKLTESVGWDPEQIAGENVLRGKSGEILTFPLAPEHNLWMIKNL